MITPVYNRTSSDCRMTAADMNRICANVNEICGGSLRTNWTSDDIVDAGTWYEICDRAAALGRYDVSYATDYINVNYIERALFDQYDETHHITATPKLTSLGISNGALSPAFNPASYTYTATVASLSSIVSATTDYSAIGYKVNGVSVNPRAVRWLPGVNLLQVTATLNGQTRTYTVTVTCTYQEAELTSLTIGGNAIPVRGFMSVTTANESDAVAYTAVGAVTMTLNGEAASPGSLTWRNGTNTLALTVTASNVKTYTVTVDCSYEALIPAIVEAINISDAEMLPMFSPDTLEYSISPDMDIGESTIDVIAGDGVDVVILFNGVQVDNGSTIEWEDVTGDVITVAVSGQWYTSRTFTISSQGSPVTAPLGPMRSGEIYSGEDLPGPDWRIS